MTLSDPESKVKVYRAVLDGNIDVVVKAFQVSLGGPFLNCPYNRYAVYPLFSGGIIKIVFWCALRLSFYYSVPSLEAM